MRTSPRKPDPSTHVHVAMNWVHHSSRMLKETASIIEAGFAERILLVGKWEPPLPESEDVGQGRQIVRLKPWTGRLPKNSLFGLLVQIEMTIRLLFFCKKLNPSVIQCHWIESFPVGYLYKKLFGKDAKIVYDAHELETEKQNIHNSVKKPIYKWLERLAIPSADLVLVVSPSIAKWYERNYGTANFVVVRNIPSRRHSEAHETPVSFRKIFKIHDDEIIFIYQGRFAASRGLEVLLAVFASLPRKYHIIFMGFGPLEASVRRASEAHENIHLHPAVPPAKILSYTLAADVGIALIENVCLSYYHCLPNKFFEYILSGIPVIASDFPDMAEILNQYQCGWTVEPTVEGLRRVIEEMTAENLATKRAQAVVASERLDWKSEAQVLVEAYSRLLSAKNETAVCISPAGEPGAQNCD